MTTRQMPLFAGLTVDETEQGWLVDVPGLTTRQVLDAIALRHPMDGNSGRPGRWVYAEEVQETTGAYGDVQRFDALAVGLVPSNNYARVIYEVKVSRADWRAERKPITDFFDKRGHRINSSLAQWSDDRLANDPLYAPITTKMRNKWDRAFELSHEFWYACPPRTIAPDELPEGAGLIEVRPWGPERQLRPRVVVPAKRRDSAHPDEGFWASVLRAVAAR